MIAGVFDQVPTLGIRFSVTAVLGRLPFLFRERPRLGHGDRALPRVHVPARTAIASAASRECARMARAFLSRVELNPSVSDAFPFLPRPPFSGSG